MKQANRVIIFFYYAPEDKFMLEELKMHMSALKQQGFVSCWHDQTIGEQTDWAKEIETRLNALKQRGFVSSWQKQTISDEADWAKELETRLNALKQQGCLCSWHDQTISGGANWAREIETHLSATAVIVLLISPDFMASDYCYGKSMEEVVKRHERQEAYVVPVIIRPVGWRHAPFGHIKGLPKEGPPVSSREDLDEGLSCVAKEFRIVLRDRLLYQKQQEADVCTVFRQYEAALPLYEQALLLDPDNATLYVLKGEAHHYLKHFEEALKAYDQAIHLANKDSVVPYLCKGDLLCELQRYEEALKAFDQAVQLNTKNWTVVRNLRPQITSWEKFQEVLTQVLPNPISAFRHSRDRQKNHEEIPRDLGLCYKELLECYEALQRHPADPTLHKEKGDLLCRLQRYTPGMLAYEQAIRLQPDFEAAYLALSLVLEYLGRLTSGKLKNIAR